MASFSPGRLPALTRIRGRLTTVAVLVCLLTLPLGACVTSISGGFQAEASDEQALRDYIRLAVAYYEAGDLTGARRHVANALQIDPRSSGAYMVQGLIAGREGDQSLAEDNFRRAIRLDGRNSRARNNYAALLFDSGRYREALRELRRVTRDTDYEGRAVAFENLGRSALRLHRREDAAMAFSRALQLNPLLYVAALELAQLRFAEEDWSAARQHFRQYLTAVDSYNIPHTPRALLAGIRIEGMFQNQSMVDSFALILSSLYPDSPEYQIYRRQTDAN